MWTSFASVVVPARNCASDLKRCLEGVNSQSVSCELEIEIIVVDDDSTDGTGEIAAQQMAKVIRIDPENAGNPARARNMGARASSGDPIIFLDADCVPQPGWLAAILASHAGGYAIVGGAIDPEPGMSFTALTDYYSGFYLVHSGWRQKTVPHHPPPNLSIRRSVFFLTRGFSESWPLYYTNEERALLADAREAGNAIVFEPHAVVRHHNRPGICALLRRSYRWGYSSIEAKNISRSARMAWLYRWPYLSMLLGLPLAIAQGLFIFGCWLRFGHWDILLQVPLLFLSRIAYGIGMMRGSYEWLRVRNRTDTRIGKWQPP